MTAATLPLWLIKYGGAPVALVAEVDRSAAARCVVATLIRDAAVGDVVAIHAGTGKPGAHGIIHDLRTIEERTPAPGTIEAAGDEHQRYGRKAPSTKANPAGVRALEAACKATSVTKEAATRSQDDTQACVRWAVWLALFDAGLNYVEIGKVTGHHRSTIDRKLDSIKGDKPVMLAKFSMAYKAASAVMMHATASRKPA